MSLVSFINRVCQYEGCTEIEKDAVNIVEFALKKGLIKTSNQMKVYAVAAVYLACKQKNLPVIVDRLASYANADRFDVLDVSKILARELGLNPVASPEPYIKKLIQEFKKKKKIERDVFEVYTMYKDRLRSRSPRTVAGALVYLVCTLRGIHIPQRRIASLLEISEVSIRNVIRIICKSTT